MKISYKKINPDSTIPRIVTHFDKWILTDTYQWKVYIYENTVKETNVIVPKGYTIFRFTYMDNLKELAYDPDIRKKVLFDSIVLHDYMLHHGISFPFYKTLVDEIETWWRDNK